VRKTRKPEAFKNFRTVSELADFLGVSERTIEKWYRGEGLPIPQRLADGTKVWSPQQCQAILRAYKTELSKKERRITRTRHG
jgi:DNA-binding transcriptional MerR regulator